MQIYSDITRLNNWLYSCRQRVVKTLPSKRKERLSSRSWTVYTVYDLFVQLSYNKLYYYTDSCLVPWYIFTKKTRKNIQPYWTTTYVITYICIVCSSLAQGTKISPPPLPPPRRCTGGALRRPQVLPFDARGRHPTLSTMRHTHSRSQSVKADESPPRAGDLFTGDRSR